MFYGLWLSMVARYDTGQYGMACKHEGVPKGFPTPQLNCSSWRAEVLGTLDRRGKIEAVLFDKSPLIPACYWETYYLWLGRVSQFLNYSWPNRLHNLASGAFGPLDSSQPWDVRQLDSSWSVSESDSERPRQIFVSAKWDLDCPIWSRGLGCHPALVHLARPCTHASLVINRTGEAKLPINARSRTARTTRLFKSEQANRDLQLPDIKLMWCGKQEDIIYIYMYCRNPFPDCTFSRILTCLILCFGQQLGGIDRKAPAGLASSLKQVLYCLYWSSPVLGKGAVVPSECRAFMFLARSTIQAVQVLPFSQCWIGCDSVASDQLGPEALPPEDIMEAMQYLEANILGNPRLPSSVKFLIGLLPAKHRPCCIRIVLGAFCGDSMFLLPEIARVLGWIASNSAP